MRGRRLGAVVAVVVAALLVAPIARPARAGDRLDRVSAALATDPLFVDPDVSTLLDATARKAIEDKIRAAKFPIYVVAIPLNEDDESGGDRQEFAYKLHQRNGRPGDYVIVDQNSNIDTLEIGVPTSFRSFQLDINLIDGNTPLPVRLATILDKIVHAPSTTPDTPSEPHPPLRVYDQPYSSAHGSSAGSFLTGLGEGAVAAGLATLLVGGLVRRLRRRARQRPDRLRPERPRRGTLEKVAERDLSRLRSELAAADDNPGRPRALSALDAAEILHAERHEPVDLLGVSVLARDGLAALAERTLTPRRPCFVDPWHGAATTTKKVRLPDLPPGQHPVCADCAAATDAARSAATLKMPGGKPYYSLPGLWHDGALTGAEPDLPQRVREFLGVQD